MNSPTSHNGFRICQSSIRDVGHGKEASVLSVTFDPGRTLKYLGSLLVGVGITTMFYMRAYSLTGATQGMGPEQPLKEAA